MKIKSIELQNILSHKSTKLAMAPLTVLRGENGSGKSTIVNSLNALLTGRDAFTNEKGSGIESLIRFGADKGVIDAEIEDGGETRTLHASITTKSGRTPTCKKDSDPSYTGSDYLAMLAIKRDILRCLIDGSWFFNPLRSDADQKDMLASIILPDMVEFEPWVWPMVSECGLTVNHDQKPFDLIQDCYDAVYDERKVVNRYLKEWREPEMPASESATVEAIRARLQERQTQRTSSAIKRQKMLDGWQSNQDARSLLSTRESELESSLDTEKERRAETAKLMFAKSTAEGLKKEAANADKAAELDHAIAVRSGEIEMLHDQLSAVQSLVNSDDAVCPTCKQSISDETRQALYLPLQEKFDAKNAEQRAAFDERKKLGDPAAAQKLIAQHIQAEKDLALIDKHVAEIEKDLDGLRKQLGSASAEKPDTSKIDEEIADLDRRIEVGNTALQNAIQVKSAVEIHAKAMAAKAALDAKHEKLEKLLEYFGPNGVSAKLLDESVSPFQNAMNAILKGWGFQCKLQFSPFEFTVGFSDNGPFLPLRTISASQKAMFQVAFQVALAKTTGFNFVVVDAADIWLDWNRSRLYMNLMGAKLDQAIVMQSDTRREIPGAKNAAFYLFTLDRSTGTPTTGYEKL
jgi:DNA repair exonuclease SbcCD ATPase subunit